MTHYDTFETESPSAYSGSYNSRIFFGNFFSAASSYERCVVADRVSGIVSSSFYNQRYTMLAADALYIKSGSYIGRNSKFMKLACETESLTDTQMPSPLYYTLANGAVPVIEEKPFSGSVYYDIPGVPLTGSAIVLFGYHTVQLFSNPSEVPLCDYLWAFSYPFQSRYKGLPVSTRPSYHTPYPITSTVSHSFDEGNGFEDSVSLTTNRLSTFWAILTNELNSATAELLVFYDPVYVSGVIGINANTSPKFLDRDQGTVPSLETLNKVYFGSGDSRYKVPNRGLYKVQSGLSTAIIGVKLRGWKYGTYDGNKKQTSMVLRANHHGFLRDILEQRHFTKVFDEVEKLTLSAPVRMSPVSGTQLYAQTLDYVTATNPSYNPRDSGAWDYECRSGQPFFDI